MLFLKAGLQTSIQDFGRTGTMHLGVSHSGAMDKTALSLANFLVGKPISSPALEITLIGPKIQFHTSMSIAICGAQFDLYLNQELVFNDESINVKADDILEFDRLNSGARAYLAFSAEADLDKVLNSYSTHLTAKIGGFCNDQFKNGDQLNFLSTRIAPAKSLEKLENVSEQAYSGKYLLRCVNGVEIEHFSDRQSENFFKSKYQVDQQSNRMGIRLNGYQIENNKIKKNKIETANQNQMTSSGLVQGSIQITPDGQPIISSVDGQTIGGYPRIANIITADLDVLGQLKAHDSVSFELINSNQASDLYNQKQNWLNAILQHLNPAIK